MQHIITKSIVPVLLQVLLVITSYFALYFITAKPIGDYVYALAFISCFLFYKTARHHLCVALAVVALFFIAHKTGAIYTFLETHNSFFALPSLACLALLFAVTISVATSLLTGVRNREKTIDNLQETLTLHGISLIVLYLLFFLISFVLVPLL